MSSSESSQCLSSCSSEEHEHEKEQDEEPVASHRHTRGAGPCESCEQEKHEKLSCESSDEENKGDECAATAWVGALGQDYMPEKISHI